MDSFDRKLSKMFDAQNDENLPVGYSWEENADAIFDKMSRKEDKRRRALLWLFLLTAIIVVICWLWLEDESQYKSDTLHIAEISSYDKSSLKPSSLESDISSPGETSADLNSTIQKHSMVDSEVNRSLNEAEEGFSRKDVLTDDRVGHQVQANRRATTDVVRSIVDYQTNIVHTPTHTSPAMGAKRRITLGNMPILQKRQLQILHPRLHGISCQYATMLDIASETSQSKYTHILTLRGGTLLSAGSYSTMSPKSDYNSWLPGYHMGLAYTIQDVSNRYVSFGYEQDLAVQYFDFAAEDQVQVNQEGVVIKRITNALTGRTTEITGDVTSSVNRSRLFQTYNTFRYHRLSLSTGGQLWSAGDFRIRAGIGVSYAVAIESAGYNISLQGEVIQYGADTTFELYKSTLWSAIGDVSLAYQLGERTELQLQSRLIGSVTNMMTTTAEELIPIHAQIGAAISYKF